MAVNKGVEMRIETKSIVGIQSNTQKEFYDGIDDAVKDGWIIALEKHRKGLSFCILYKEIVNGSISTH